MKHSLYPWQEECLKKWCKNHYHGIINVITGSGKTYLALAAAMHLKKLVGVSRLRVKIVVPSASLLTQWTLAIMDFFGDSISRRDIGLYYSGQKDTPDHLFMIYVINSARYSLARHVVKDLSDGRTVFLIADECHRYVGSENQKIFEFLPAATACPERYASIGLSATPGLKRPDNASVLIPALGKEIFRYGLKEAEEEHTLCPYAAFHIALSFTAKEQMEYEDLSFHLSKSFSNLINHYPSLKGIRGSQFFSALRQIAGDRGKYAYLARQYLSFSYRRKSLTSDAQSRIGCVLKLISLLDRSSRIIVFGERIKQADCLYEQLNKRYPNQSARCHSDMDSDTRKLALQRFHNGEVRILVSCRALDEGFDVPSANVGIVMSSASVNRQRIQRLGRILRRYEGKEISSLYYLFIADSSEEPTYFPTEAQTAAVCELSYHMENHAFSYPDYEARVKTAIRTFERKNPDSLLLSEAVNCFNRGIIRPDWLLGVEYCSRKLNAARTTSERNYWICMKQIAGDQSSSGYSETLR